MKILWVSLRAYPSIGGSETLFYEFMKRLVKDGHSVSVLTTDILTTRTMITNRGYRIKPDKEIKDGIFFRRFRTARFRGDRKLAYILGRFGNTFLQFIFGWPYVWSPGLIWYAYTSKEDYDLVIAGPHPYYTVIYPALSFAKRKGIPFIDYALLHTGLPHSNIKANKHINKYILEHSDCIIGATEAERKIIEKIGVDGSKFYTTGAGINPDEIKGGDGNRFREKYGIKGDIILQVSVQSREKGTITLLKAGELLIRKGMPVNIILIGEITDKVEVYYKDLPHNIKRYIKLLGSITERDKKDAIAASNVYVMASEVDSFGIAYLEAWMYKKPVIGAYAGGIPYVIDNGVNGYLIPFGDYHILSEYIEILLKNKELAKKFGENGYKKTLKKYTWDIQYQKFRKIIENFSSQRNAINHEQVNEEKDMGCQLPAKG